MLTGFAGTLALSCCCCWTSALCGTLPWALPDDFESKRLFLHAGELDKGQQRLPAMTAIVKRRHLGPSRAILDETAVYWMQYSRFDY